MPGLAPGCTHGHPGQRETTQAVKAVHFRSCLDACTEHQEHQASNQPPGVFAQVPSGHFLGTQSWILTKATEAMQGVFSLLYFLGVIPTRRRDATCCSCLLLFYFARLRGRVGVRGCSSLYAAACTLDVLAPSSVPVAGSLASTPWPGTDIPCPTESLLLILLHGLCLALGIRQGNGPQCCKQRMPCDAMWSPSVLIDMAIFTGFLRRQSKDGKYDFCMQASYLSCVALAPEHWLQHAASPGPFSCKCFLILCGCFKNRKFSSRTAFVHQSIGSNQSS